MKYSDKRITETAITTTDMSGEIIKSNHYIATEYEIHITREEMWEFVSSKLNLQMPIPESVDVRAGYFTLADGKSLTLIWRDEEDVVDEE